MIFATFILLLTGAVLSDGFLFPDQVSSNAKSESWHGDDGRSNLNSYGDSFNDHRNHQPFDYDNSHRPTSNKYFNGNQGGFAPGFGNHHGHGNRGSRQNHQYYGGIVSQSGANAQSTGFGSQANSQSGSLFFNGASQSSAHSQAQSQGYQSPGYPFGPSGGGSGASSASSAASATSGIVDGIASASAAAAAASASSGGGASVASSSSSSSSSGNNGGYGHGNPPWFYRSRVAGEDGNSDAGIDGGGPVATNDRLIFSEK